MAEGYIKLYRQLQEHEIWTSEPFTKGQAWVDLILQANHKDGQFIDGMEVVKVERGAMITSVKKLAERWKWSRHKVGDFLDLLEGLKMVGQKRDTKRTYLKIVQYCVWQDLAAQEGHQKDIKRTSTGHQKDTNNNDNNDKNIGGANKNSLTPKELMNSRKEKFKDSLKVYLPIYGRDLLNAFFGYWTEPNKSGIKMRFEMEKAWDVKRRLETWASKDKNWNKPKTETDNHLPTAEDVLRQIEERKKKLA